MISVIINCYNSEKYISKCLESVLNQTYKDLEILIINDGSTDDTLKIIKSYKDKRIKVINTPDIGISRARNVAIDNFKGDYIFFIDADDFIEKDTIDYLYKLIKKYKVEMATCMSQVIYNYDFIKEKPNKDVDYIDSIEVLKKVLLSIERNGNIWGKLMHKELVKNHRFEEREVSDVCVIYKMLLDIKKVAYGRCVKYYYLKHQGSILARNNPKRAKDFYNASIERYEYIKNIYPDMIENDICLLSMITTIYQHNDKDVNKYLINHDAKKIFNKLFSFKVLKYKMPLKEKLKLIMFRINPGLLVFTVSFYLKLKK